jgi:hypothetical protein
MFIDLGLGSTVESIGVRLGPRLAGGLVAAVRASKIGFGKYIRLEVRNGYNWGCYGR